MVSRTKKPRKDLGSDSSQIKNYGPRPTGTDFCPCSLELNGTRYPCLLQDFHVGQHRHFGEAVEKADSSWRRDVPGCHFTLTWVGSK